MPNRIHNAANYSFTEKDKLCLDTNVWLCLFPAPSSGKDPWTDAYSKTYRAIIQSGASVVIDISVLSEYLNRYARYEWDAYEKDKITKEHFRRFKDFRDSVHFMRAAFEKCSAWNLNNAARAVII